ncbi:MAG: putative Phosphotransferase [Nitrospira sp.]
MAGLSPLAGDASNRRYFRIALKGTPPALILMQLADPEGFKKSEEAVSGASAHIAELPFTNVLTHLQRTGVTVPTLHYFDREAGLLYLEDFGDLTLAEACRHAAPAKLDALYRQAIDQLTLLQVKGTTPPAPGCIAFHRRFDVPLLMWEFDHFLEYGITARIGRPMKAEDEAGIRIEFKRIAGLLAGQPQVLVHRDYHSRNLMVDGARMGIIDFQDALMGPATYDLASLLKDAYIELDDAVVDALVEHFLDRLEGLGAKVDDREAFRRLFDLTSIQRNLKAAGRFVYIDRVKHNPKFLADIPRVLGYVKRNLAKYPELATLRQHLAPYVTELQEP